MIDQLLERFPITPELPSVFPIWLDLVTSNQIKGTRTHDVRIAAVMLASEISHILTLNPNDFLGIPDVMIVRPRDIIKLE